MRATLQTASDRLYQLEKDNADLVRNLEELANLRELVRRKEVIFRAKRAYRERSTTILRTKAADPSRDQYRTAG
jgi:hypothetical protein